MLTLDTIRENIAALPAIDTNEGKRAAVEDIFLSLLCADIPLFIAFSDTEPYLAPLNGKQFFRLFSHRETAEQYAQTHETLTIREITAIESLQIAKYGLLHDGYGYLLNRGDKWVTLALTSYLKLFYNHVLQDESLYDEAYVSQMQTEETEQAGDWHMDNIFLCFPQDENSAPSDENEQPDQTYDEAESNADELNAPEDETDPNAPVCWDTDDTAERMSYNPEELSETAELGGRAAKGEGVGDDAERYVLGRDFPDTESDSPDTADPESDMPRLGVDADDPKVDAEKKPSRRLWTRKIPSFSRKTRKERQAVPRHRRTLLFGGAVAATAALIVSLLLCFTIGQQYITPSNYTRFCTALDAREYGTAYTQYEMLKNRSNANEYLSDHVDWLITLYGSGKISKAEVEASMQALAAFPSLQQDLASAHVSMEKLNESKDAYAQGEAADSVYEKLSFWRKVIAMDTVNAAAVQKSVSDNTTQWSAKLEDELRYYSTRVRVLAKERYELLDFWYPDSPAVAEWEEAYRDEPVTPLSHYPIYVKTVNAYQNGSGEWVLEIEWENRSVRNIDEVTFSVVAKDAMGKIVTSKDASGSWSIFDARAPGPFEPNIDGATYRQTWTHVFSYPLIEAVEMTAINVTYSDGTSTCYTTQTDLDEILKE